MKHLVSALALCAALPVCAATLTVNAPATSETLSNDQTVTITDGVSLAVGDTAVFSAKLKMTLPSEAVDRTEQLTDKVAITADKDGTVLVYTYVDGEATPWQWREISSDFTVAEGDTLNVEVAVSHEQDADGERANYRVTAWKDAETRARVAYAAPQAAGDLDFAEMELDGEGEATGLAVAAVPTAILPASEGGTQDAELVSDYVTWLNDADKGGAMPEGSSETELSDAFAMNVGGTPSLAITAITPPADGQAGSITVAGSYVPVSADGTAVQAEATPAPLNAINGTLYITYASELGGEAKTQAVEISAADDETKTVTLPKGAVFVKARVALTQPTDTTL